MTTHEINGKGLGLIYSQPDKNDYTLEAVGITADPNMELHEITALYTAEVTDQGPTSKCLPHAMTGVKSASFEKETGHKKTFAVDWIYGNRIHYKGEGMIFREALRKTHQDGMPYARDFQNGPTAAECIAEVEKRKHVMLHRTTPYRYKTYVRLWTEQEVYQFIKRFAIPCVMAFDVYDNIRDTGSDGIIPSPEGTRLGGHAVQIIGIRQIGERWYYVIQNSWGKNWGENGYGYLETIYARETWGLIEYDPITEREDIETVIVDTLKGKITTITRKGKVTEAQTETINQAGRIYLQMRSIFDSLGWEQIRWDNIHKRAVFQKYKSYNRQWAEEKDTQKKGETK